MKYRKITKTSIIVASDEIKATEAIKNTLCRLKDYETKSVEGVLMAAEFFLDYRNHNERGMQVEEIMKALKEEGF